MEIVSVSGYVHIVPVVVIERTVGVALDQVCSIAQVRNVMKVAREGKREKKRGEGSK